LLSPPSIAAWPSGTTPERPALVTRQATLDGLSILAAPAWQTAAEDAYRESVAAWRADHEASVRRRQERDVRALVALVAEAVRDRRRAA
jgi:hypothetical protein